MVRYWSSSLIHDSSNTDTLAQPTDLKASVSDAVGMSLNKQLSHGTFSLISLHRYQRMNAESVGRKQDFVIWFRFVVPRVFSSTAPAKVLGTIGFIVWKQLTLFVSILKDVAVFIVIISQQQLHPCVSSCWSEDEVWLVTLEALRHWPLPPEAKSWSDNSQWVPRLPLTCHQLVVS